MRETFPHKSKGDTLSADHINRLSDVARRLASGQTGSYLYGNDQQLAGPIPFIQRLMIVTEVPFPDEYDGCDGNDDAYKCKPIYYDHDTKEWKTNDDAEDSCLDADVLGAIFQTGQKLTAWYDPQRGAYIPLSFPIIKGKTLEVNGKTVGGRVKIYQGEQGNEQETNKEIVPYNSFAEIPEDAWVAMGWIGDGYEIIAAECDTEE